MSDTNQEPAPPLGLEREYTWRLRRIDDICAAVTRYRDAQMEVPPDWYAELGKLCCQGYEASSLMVQQKIGNERLWDAIRKGQEHASAYLKI